MDFTKTLLEEIKKRREISRFEEALERLRNKKIVGIWGTGLAGATTYEAAERLGVEIQFFLDNDEKKIGKKLNGKEIRSIQEMPPQAFIIISANVRYQIHKQLEAVHAEYCYLDPNYLFLWQPGKEPDEIFQSNSNQINKVYSMLADDASRKVFYNVLLHRAVHDLNLIWEVYDERSYFGNPIVKQAKGCFVDCGAYQGDTLEEFLNQVGTQEYRYFALEADRGNYDILKKRCEERQLTNVYPLNLGVWDKKETLYFCRGGDVTGDVSGKVVPSAGDDNVKMEVESLDHIFSKESIDFIKMDIEGAEMRALEGARRSIEKSKPILAVSAYHLLEHLWQIPLFIREMSADYKIYFGHHMWNLADTVCYGLIKEERK